MQLYEADQNGVALLVVKRGDRWYPSTDMGRGDPLRIFPPGNIDALFRLGPLSALTGVTFDEMAAMGVKLGERVWTHDEG